MNDQANTNEPANTAQAAARVGTGFGFAIMLLGVLCMMTPFVTGIAVTTMIAIGVIAAGAVMAAYAFRAGSLGRGLFQLLFGGITILAGIALLTAPMAGLFALTTVLIAWFLVDGIFAIVIGLRGKGNPGWGWMTVSGIASILLAVLLYQQWPASGAFAVGLLTGVRLIFTGWSIAMLGMIANDAGELAEQKAD